MELGKFLIYSVICIALVIGALIYFSEDTQRKQNNSTTPSSASISNIEKYLTPEDLTARLTQESQRINNQLARNRYEIEKALQSANRVLEIESINSFARVQKVVDTLNETLKYHQRSSLTTSKFHYYTGLHFRSMNASNEVFKECKRMNNVFMLLNNKIVEANRYGRASIGLISSKNAIKDAKEHMYNELHKMNQQVASLRDRIGLECGQRGRDWWYKIVGDRQITPPWNNK